MIYLYRRNKTGICFDDGVVRGREEGKKAATERMSMLTAKLPEENRLDDLKKITQDEEFREQLM